MVNLVYIANSCEYVEEVEVGTGVAVGISHSYFYTKMSLQGVEGRE